LRVSIVVPAHVAGPSFERCLSSLRALSPPPDEIIIVDASGNGRCTGAARTSGFRVLETAGAQGPAVARNLGAAAARGELLLFFDADVAVPTDAVARIRRHFSSAPDLAAVIGSYDDAPADPGFMSQYKNLVHRYVHQTSREDASTFWGACGAVRRASFEAVGGFDERYARASIEDIELGYRLRAAGKAIRLDRSLQVTHLKRWTPGSLLVSDIRDRAVPWTRLALEHGRLPDDLNLRTSSRIAAGLVWLTIAAGLAAMMLPQIWPVLLLLVGALIAIDARLWNHLRAARGAWFAARAMGWHWLYYIYSSATFVGVAFAVRLKRS
jgi:GT2 family glycosyltransferase